MVAVTLGCSLAAAYIHFGPRVLVGLAGLLIWPGYLVFRRASSIELIGGGTLTLSRTLDSAIEGISKASPDRIQEVAAAEIRLLSDYYTTALGQARTSFKWALAGVGVGLLFFSAAIVVELASDATDAATISAVAGAVVELISGLNFVLYGKTIAQLSEFHERLERTQRYLLANSMCESLNAETRDGARSDLIKSIAAYGSSSA